MRGKAGVSPQSDGGCSTPLSDPVGLSDQRMCVFIEFPGDLLLLLVWETHLKPLGFLSLSFNIIFFLTKCFKPQVLYLVPVACVFGGGRLEPSCE